MWGEEGYFYDEFEVNVVDHQSPYLIDDCYTFDWSETTDSPMTDLDINVVANGEGVIFFIPFPINGPSADATL